MKLLKLTLILITLVSCDRTHKKVIEKFEDNSVKTEYIYSDNDVKNEYKYIEYYKNRNIKFEGFIKDNYYRGIKKNYYENGNPKEFCHLTDSGKFSFCCPDRFYEMFHSNGNLKETHSQTNGIISGLITNYDTSGTKTNEFFNENNMKNGVAKLYHPSGTIRSLQQYKNDTLINSLVDFFESGDTSFMANINMGNIYFPIRKWNKQGVCISGFFLDENEEKVKWIWTDSQGEVIKTEVLEANDEGFTIPDFK